MLQHHDFSDSPARCIGCGKLAAGPCAACEAPVCGDCCVLTTGGAKTYAVCLDCDRRRGRSLWGPWATVALWIGGPIAALALAVALLAWIVR